MQTENDFGEFRLTEKTNDELLTMVYQFDLWSPQMLQAVETELQSRNILPGDIQQRRQDAIKTEDEILSKRKQASLIGQIFGWIGILGLLGLVIGYNYYYSKTTSKYTKKTYYTYTRIRGIMVAICFLFLLPHILVL